MRVLFLNLPFPGVRAGSRWAHRTKIIEKATIPFPFNMGFAAALLENNGFEVGVIDSIAEKLCDEEFRKKVTGLVKTGDVAVIETATASIHTDLDYARWLKTLGAKVVLTGPHVSALPHEKYPCDHIIRKEYELSLLDLVKKIKQRKKAVKIIEGVSLNSLDVLPRPAWHLFPLRRYNEGTCKFRPNFQHITSKGCPFRCKYCYTNVLYSRGWRPFSVERVISDVRHALEEYSWIKEVYFDDDTGTVNKNRTVKLAKEMGKLRIPWSIMAHFSFLDKETIKAMAKNNCDFIKIGIESADPQILKNMGRPTDVDKAKKVVGLCKKYGIRVHATYMVGYVGDEWKSVKKTAKLIKELKTESLQISIATPLPGTPFYEECERNSWLSTRDFSEFSGSDSCVVNYPNLSCEEVMKMYEYLWWTQRGALGKIKALLKGLLNNLGVRYER